MTPDGNGRDWLTASLRGVGWWMLAMALTLVALACVLIALRLARRPDRV